ncbi:hypothetical protein GGS26DRAFT_604982 [Hypomontagnella submonticulosa]|nr:hypothetical protein GGS26DRAFT_604982 [Hypomontagnella submonticulosa]
MDDSKDHLLQISDLHKKSVIELLLAVQEENEQRAEILPKFLDKLECFSIDVGETDNIELKRRWINVSSEKNYIALSYTWSPSKWEEQDTKGRYWVETRSRAQFFLSPVRSCILNRITRYMRHTGVELLWIDRHSIPQRTCKDHACEHSRCEKKAAALRSMDWVYKESRHPVALLGRPIDTKPELELLRQILITTDYTIGVSWEWMNSALELLHKITSDLWWQRAWTFQENYKGGKKMNLLIPHPPSLEVRKRNCGIFGDVPGEICVQSIELFEKATHLCLAYKDRKDITSRAEEMIEQVLAKAGRYKELLDKSRPMDPAIISDTEKRDVKEPWDRLSIVANCCDYPVRLNEKCLKYKGCSLSLSMLAMCLLNGLILHNGVSHNTLASKMCVSEFLEAQCFGSFDSPPGALSLTFNKGCRFINVELTEVGVGTEGHLWELGPIIDTSKFGKPPPLPKSSTGNLDLELQWYLDALCHVWELRESYLANLIQAYLSEGGVGNGPYRFGEDYMFTMTVTVASAIKQKKKVRLGRYWDPKGKELFPYTAVFVWPEANTKRLTHEPRFVFTSSRPKEMGTGGYCINDTDRHVSLEVRLEENQANGGVPYLYTERSLLGMCFFRGYPRNRVVFPWPQALKDIKPKCKDTEQSR